MTLPSSGMLTTAQLSQELYGNTTTIVDLTGADARALAGKPTGVIVFPNDFWGKSKNVGYRSWIGMACTVNYSLGDYAWIYAVKFYKGATLMATATAQQLSNLSAGNLYYEPNHHSGAPAAMWPYSYPDVTFDTGVTVGSDWTHVVVEWGGGMGGSNFQGYTATRTPTAEKSRINWGVRNSVQTYANRFIDQVNLF